eukprot:4320984-Alexandrium_andersonii.AAC.1
MPSAMDQYFVNTFAKQMVDSHEFSMRDDMPLDEIERRKLQGLNTFPFPNYYEPLCFGTPAEGQGGLDLGEGGRLDLDAL